MQKNILKKQNGITMIALIITIIILIILAGISITMFVSSENVDKAFESKVVTELSQIGEEINKIKIQAEEDNLQNGIYSDTINNDILIEKNIILNVITINEPSIKIGILDISKIGMNSTLGNNAKAYETTTNLDKITDLEDVYVINLDTNDIYYIKDKKVYTLKGVVNPEELVDPIITTEGPIISAMPNSTEFSENISFTITVSKGKDNIDIKEDAEYKYYLSTKPNETVGGEWSNYISGQEIIVEKTGTRQYYLFVKAVEDKNNNKSTAVGSDAREIKVYGENFHRFGPYDLNSSNETMLIIDPNGGKYKNSSSRTEIEGKNNDSIIINSTDITPGKGFRIIFASNGGSMSETEIISEKAFKGWTLTGKGSFTNNTYTFGEGVGILTANYENKPVTLPTPTRMGYRFIGWYDSVSDGNKIGDANSEYIPNKDITLYAQWIYINSPPISPIQISFSPNENSTYATSHSVVVNVKSPASGFTTLRAGWHESSKNLTSISDFAQGWDIGSEATVTGSGVTGDYRLWVYAQDTAGNTKIARTEIFKFDNTGPSVPTVTYNGGANTCVWKNNYNITLSSVDSQSGVAYYEIDFNADNIADATTGSNFIPWNNYHSCLNRFRAVDNLGNVSAWTDVHHIHMDTEAPGQTTVNLNGYADGTWTNGNVRQDFSATENIGVAYYQYTYDNGITVQNVPSNPWTINNDGLWSFYVRAVDHAGNVGAWSEAYTIARDTVVPTITIDTMGLDGKDTGEERAIWFWHAVSDDRSGVMMSSYVQYWFEGQNPTTENLVFGIPFGKHFMYLKNKKGTSLYAYVYATDLAGNISSTYTYRWILAATPVSGKKRYLNSPGHTFTGINNGRMTEFNE